MKNFKSVLLLMLIIAGYEVQGQAFVKGTNVISLGLGLGSHFSGYSYDSRTPTISFQYEKGLWNVGPGVISLGGYAGFTTYRHNFSNNKVRSSYSIIGARGAYHYNGWPSGHEALKKLDVYAGLMVSYHFTADEYYDYGNYASVSPYVGGRYFFAKNFGGFAEVGYGVSYLTVGVCLKF